MIRTSNKVALYARFSSDNQRSESIDAQIRAMTTYCQQHNFIIVNTYVDEAKSATTDRRPAFQQMIADSEHHSFNILLVHKLDRFARNRYDSAVYKRELKKNGVQVYSVLENLDDSPESIMMEAVLEGMAEYYSQNLGREVMKGMRETALQCKHTGGQPPLGYDVDATTKKLVVNEEEAEAVKLIFRMYSEGQGYSAILEALYKADFKTKNGKPFQKNSLYSILTNPKYQGMYIFNRSSAKSVTGKRNTHLLKDDEEIIAIDGGCPQIVDRETYEKVQVRINENRHTGGRLNAKNSYLLSGKVYCKDCGKSMVGNTRFSGRNKALYVTYRCPSKRYYCSNREINKTCLEEYVVMLLEKHILNTRSLLSLSKKLEKQAYLPQKHQENIQEKLDEINVALKNVADAVAAGLLSDALIERLNELEAQKTKLEAEMHVTPFAPPAVCIDPTVILAQYRQLKESTSSPQYKEFIRSLIDKIVVGKYVVDITLKTGLDICPELDTTFSVRRQEIYEAKKMA